MRVPDGPSLRDRLALGRLLVGSVVETVVKAYGVGAAAAAALSDAETVGGKAADAFRAVPTLAEEYRQAKFVVDHREEIQTAIDYVNEHTPAQEELQASADQSVETLRGIESTYDDVGATLDALPFSPLDALGHAQDAWSGRPSLDSIRELAETAEQVGPYVEQAAVLGKVYHGGLVSVIDNFSSDEIAGTVLVILVALGLAGLLGRLVGGLWIRRGRPGICAHLLQLLGAHLFRRWYVDNLPYALGPSLHAAARERFQRDVVADPQEVLDPEALRGLELYFATRAKDGPADPAP